MIIHHAMTAKIQIWAPPESTSIKKLMFCGSQTELVPVPMQPHIINPNHTTDIISDTP
jgi:hypothetical protein